MTTSAKWTPLPPVAGGNNPCLSCPPILSTLDMGASIAVGFGYAALECDGEVLYDESEGSDLYDALSVADAEAIASADPDHDWRIVMHGPLHGETYQRQGPGQWVLVERNEGFA